MTKRKQAAINHSDEQVDVTVPNFAQNRAEADTAEIEPTVTEKWFDPRNPVVPTLLPLDLTFVVTADTVDGWNELFFAIKALKNNPSEALQASKMRRLLEKLP